MMAERRIGRGKYSEIDDEGGTLLPHPIGTTMSLADYQQLQNNYVGRPELYHETRGMTPEQFLRSPYSQYQLQPDGTVRFRGMGEGWQNPTWIDQDPNSIGAGLKQALPYLAAFTGAGAALGGLSGMGIPGLFGGEAAAGGASSFLPNSFDMTLGGLGDAAGIGVGDVVPTSAAFGGETYLPGVTDLVTSAGETYLPGVLDKVPATLGQMGASGGLPSWVSPAASGLGAAATLAGGEGGAMDMYGSTSPNSSTTADVFNYKSPTSLADILKASAPAAQTAAALKNLLGIDVSPGALGMLGTGLSTALGAYGANQQANSLQKIADQSRADRQPFLNDALDMLQNPNKFYERPEVTGAIDASLRGLSARVGNPINNPGALAQQAAYNLGMYNNALTSRANLGLSGQDTTSRLQTNAALANNGLYNALGSGLGSMLSTTPNMNLVLADYLSRQL